MNDFGKTSAEMDASNAIKESLRAILLAGGITCLPMVVSLQRLFAQKPTSGVTPDPAATLTGFSCAIDSRGLRAVFP